MNSKNTQKIALSKWLARSGAASRRESTKAIAEGKVMVNGKLVKEPYFRLDPTSAQVTLDGKPVKVSLKPQYYLINKPPGVISSTSRQQTHHRLVTDLLPQSDRLYPVGRLDQASEGLLLLTNDGDLAYRLTHPKFQVQKTYHVLVSGQITTQKLARLSAGVMLAGIKTNPATVKILKHSGQKTWLEITISQGRYHQIRRMCSAVSLEVFRLIRVKEGDLELGDLPVGHYRKLTPEEIDQFKQIIPLKP